MTSTREQAAQSRKKHLEKSRRLVRAGDRFGSAQEFEFVRAHQAIYPVRTLCRVLGVSPSGYYAYVKRPRSRRAVEDAGLLERIEHVHARSRGTYGAPRIHRDLREEDTVRVGQKRVARLMRQAGIVRISRRKRRITTRRDVDGRPAPDLVDRDFQATGPDQLWVADITYVPTHAGFLYLAVVVDAWSRRVVGWSMANHLRTELVLTALEIALQQRRLVWGLPGRIDPSPARAAPCDRAPSIPAPRREHRHHGGHRPRWPCGRTHRDRNPRQPAWQGRHADREDPLHALR
ncbi:MAG: IS3 family transposase [Polyangiales bacterium]